MKLKKKLRRNEHLIVNAYMLKAAYNFIKENGIYYEDLLCNVFLRNEAIPGRELCIRETICFQ